MKEEYDPLAEDLIERLRHKSVRQWVHSPGDVPLSNGYKPDADCIEAADEIASLRAELRHWEMAASAEAGEVDRLRAEVVALQQQVNSFYLGNPRIGDIYNTSAYACATAIRGD